MRIFHVRGCIIEISALGRIKSGRRDQWLTRIVGAVRKIPYLHTKIHARPFAEPVFSFFFLSILFLPFSERSKATFSLHFPLPPSLFSLFHTRRNATRLNQIMKLDAPSNTRIISCATLRANGNPPCSQRQILFAKAWQNRRYREVLKSFSTKNCCVLCVRNTWELCSFH